MDFIFNILHALRRINRLPNGRKTLFRIYLLIFSTIILELVILSISRPETFKFLNKITIIQWALIVISVIGFLAATRLSNNSTVNLEEIDLKYLNERTNIENIINTASKAYEIINQQIMQLNRLINITEFKASSLLTVGKYFIYGGICFYSITIITWQFLTWGKTPNTGNVIGMFECTGIFIFLEIIAAWYLKQYRYYVDKATYFIKVKAIFDKYLINYLLAEENKFKTITHKNLFEYFSKEINWPKDNHLNKNKSDDIHESLLGTIKELSLLLKDKKEKSSQQHSE